MEQAHKELIANEPIYNQYYSLPNYELTRERLKRKNQDYELCKMMFKHFPTPKKYFQQIGALDYFVPIKKKIQKILKEIN